MFRNLFCGKKGFHNDVEHISNTHRHKRKQTYIDNLIGRTPVFFSGETEMRIHSMSKFNYTNKWQCEQLTNESNTKKRNRWEKKTQNAYTHEGAGIGDM